LEFYIFLKSQFDKEDQRGRKLKPNHQKLKIVWAQQEVGKKSGSILTNIEDPRN
jgi:hypothetical protein